MDGAERSELVAEVRALREALSERDTLLRDVHHRVKNNLFLLIGLLSFERRKLQSELPEPELALEAIDRVTSRIHVISSIYSHLYEFEPSARTISASVYLEQLTRLVRVAETERPITLTSDIGEIELPVETALPVGLIVNEALSNSYKHAFPDGRQGTITVLLERIAGGRARLVLSDDGVGKLPSAEQGKPAGSQSHTTHLGRNLIHALVQQLNGTLRDESGRGTTIEVEFPLAPDG